MKTKVIGAVVVLAMVSAASAGSVDSFGTGSNQFTMDFVTVGNAGNTGELSGAGAGGGGLDRICGAVGYAYNIGKYEVTAAQWAAVIAAAPGVGNAGSWTGSQPTAGTSWNEAAKFCNWLTSGSAIVGYYTISDGVASIPEGVSHNVYAAEHGTTYFIPTEDEWYKAAFHKNNGVTGGAANYWDYPTGSDTMPTAVTGGTGAGTAVFYGNGVSPTAPAVVSNAGGLSAYDTMGQGGNVWEWNEAIVYDGSYRGLRAGSFRDAYSDGKLHASFRDYFYDPTCQNNDFGFRVASVPEPATLSLLALGGLAVLRRKK